MITMATWDWKDSSGEALLKAMKELGLFSYAAPSFEGSDEFGYIISTEELSKKEVKQYDKEQSNTLSL